MKRTTVQLFTTATMLSGLILSAAAMAGDMSSADMIKKMDTDGDGRVSMAEHDAGARMMFTKMDANKDGSITAAEMDAGKKMMMKDHAGMDGMKSSDMKSSDMTSKEPMPAKADDGN